MDLLNAVFGKIIIPQAVYNELCELADQKKILDDQNWILVVAAENRSAITQCIYGTPKAYLPKSAQKNGLTVTFRKRIRIKF